MSPESNKTPQHMWTAFGRNAKTIQEDPTKMPADEIAVFEEPYSFRMGGDESGPAYGVPITPKGAVYLMCRLLKVLMKAEIPMEELPEKMIDDPIESIKDREKLMEALLTSLVASFGMTFDRSVILKILSQPSCEGIRFYPCLKYVGGKDYVSLVLTGVDSTGQDLHFKGIKSSDILDLVDAAENSNAIESKSLLSEYGHPPTAKNWDEGNIKYWLLQLAREAAGIKLTEQVEQPEQNQDTNSQQSSVN